MQRKRDEPMMDRMVHNVTIEGRFSGSLSRLRAIVGFNGAPDGAREPCIGLSSERNC